MLPFLFGKDENAKSKVVETTWGTGDVIGRRQSGMSRSITRLRKKRENKSWGWNNVFFKEVLAA